MPRKTHWLFVALIVVIGFITAAGVLCWQGSIIVRGQQEARQQALAVQTQIYQAHQAKNGQWLTYANSQYGFRFAYPKDFNNLAPTAPETRSSNPYLEKTPQGEVSASKYGEKITALSTLLTTKKDNNANLDISLYLSVFPLNNYVYNDVPGGIDYQYDSLNNTWQQPTYNDIKKTLEEKTISLNTIPNNGWTGFRLRWGDVGTIDDCVAVPYPAKNIMIEICILTQANPEINYAYDQSFVINIVKTLKFTD